MKLGAILQTSAFAIRTAISVVRGSSKFKKRSTNLRFAKIKTWLAALVLASLSTGSYATWVSSSINNPLNFTWSYNTGLSLLTGSGSMTVAGFNSTALTVTVSLMNSSSLASDKLIAFGFGIIPDATGVSFVDAADGGIVGASVSGGTNLGNGTIVEVCVWAGSSCQGGAIGGIFGGGGVDTFSVNLSGFWGGSIWIEPLAFKYSTGFGPFAFTSDMSGPPNSGGGSTGGSSGNVPEPGTGALALLSLGLLGAGFGLRRRPPPASA